MDRVTELLEANYRLRIYSAIKEKNIYKVYSEEGCYCFKLIRYKYSHFKFIISAIEHLERRGFKELVPIIPTVKGERYIAFGEGYGYLSPWLRARECNYDNPYDLLEAARALARLHNYSEGFMIKGDMSPRIGWFSWIQTFETRINEILDFRKRISQKAKKSGFDCIYLEMMEKELIIAESAIANLKKAGYREIMMKDIFKGGFCHHDFAHHNILIGDKGKVNIIDFDYCILDSNLHDLSSLLLRAMKNGRWELEKSELILNGYREEKIIRQEQIPVIAAFMEFPQDYWQIGLQYYWEQQSYGEEFFVNRLKKIKEDILDKQEFIETFRLHKLHGGKG
ncbi:CotS family spore coat protein [Alloiococcus sp. CFN-8]|uniref:CotS family spore coat protein n=1 Tax=Alloiococcus sp. CFN-8 TaxID=3416081 RepID=UPI003CECD7EB